MKVYIKKYITILFILVIFLTSCNSSNSQNIINVSDIQNSSTKIDELNVQRVIMMQEEKYKRHYQNGLYFDESLSKSKEELNQKYNQYLKEKIDTYLKENSLTSTEYILRTNVEIVNQDVKDYLQGKLSAKKIFETPGNTFMSVDVQFYVFMDKKNYEIKKDVYNPNRNINIITNTIKEYYKSDVEYINYLQHIYDKKALNNHSISELEKEKYINLLLADTPYVLQECSFFNNYFEEPFVDNGIIYFWRIKRDNEWEEIIKKKLKSLKEKYNIEFFNYNSNWYAPKNNPDLFFLPYSGFGEYRDYFLSTLCQYLLNKEISKIIQEEGVSDKVVFFVETEPESIVSKEGVSYNSYNLKDKFDEKEFLKNGYTGNVNVVFIYLKNKNDEIDYKVMKRLFLKTDELLYSEKIEKAKKEGEEVGFRRKYFYNYNIDDYGRKVVIDLFKKHPITERQRRKNDLGLAGALSLVYETRAETPGFHYLDIFADMEEDYYSGPLFRPYSSDYDEDDKSYMDILIESPNKKIIRY